MNKVTIIIIAIMVYTNAIAQKITTDKVPTKASSAFKAKFPAAKQESWSIESPGIYEVEFINGAKTQSAEFDETGNWLETETKMDFKHIPQPVTQAFTKQFEGFNVQEANKVETPKANTTYEIVAVKGKDGYEIMFSAEGKMLKKNVEKVEK